jgi:hypothetical protein
VVVEEKVDSKINKRAKIEKTWKMKKKFTLKLRKLINCFLSHCRYTSSVLITCPYEYANSFWISSEPVAGGWWSGEIAV